MANTPRHEQITGAQLTGTEPTTNRTYTLAYTGAQNSFFHINKNGTNLLQGADFTLSNDVITFTVAVWDADVMVLDYFTSSGASSASDTSYATTLELVKFMGLLTNTIDRTNNTLLENFGTGDGSATKFYLNQDGLINGTYSLYYGATEAAALSQPLTESTHYSIDVDTGEVTLTATGVTLVSTDNLYAKYNYNTVGLQDCQFQDALNRAAKFFDSETNNHFANGTDATPDYNQVSNEKHTGKGSYDRTYYTDNYPLPDVSTSVAVDSSVGDTIVYVDSTSGFPSSGTIAIGTEKITYSSKTGTSFVCSATSAAHSDGDYVSPHIIEVSTDDEGTAQTWVVRQLNTDYDLDLDSGRVFLYNSSTTLTSYDYTNPPRSVPSRVRLSYLWGENSIPDDVVKCVLMLASKDIMHMAVRSAHSQGKNDFEPTLINVDEQWIDDTIAKYMSIKTTNVG